MVMTPSKANLSSKLIEALSNPIFPELDTLLRSGRHICSEDMEKHSFVHEYFSELDSFYRRYSVELIRAPEDFYYLRTKSTSIIASSQLSELEMMAGKILCLLYLSPERLAQQGIFTPQEVYDELISLVEVERLVKLINPRSTGSDIDKAKLMEKLRASLGRLARMGIISYRDKERNKFLIRSACFRFGAEVRSGEDSLVEQEKLIRSGEAVTEASLKEQAQAQAALEATLISESQDTTQTTKNLTAVNAHNLSNTSSLDQNNNHNVQNNNSNESLATGNEPNNSDIASSLLDTTHQQPQTSASHFDKDTNTDPDDTTIVSTDHYKETDWSEDEEDLDDFYDEADYEDIDDEDDYDYEDDDEEDTDNV